MKKLYKFIILISLFTSLFANTSLIKIDRFYPKSQENDIYICFHLTKYFNEYSSKKLKPFIKITPKRDFTIQIGYKEICIGNLEPSKEYKIFISQNIPLDPKLRLDKDYQATIKTLNYAPSFSFKEDGYIIPEGKDISIPIETRNVDKLSISLYRINSNNLIDAINRYGLVRSLEYYELREIENEKGYKLWDKIVILKNEPNIKKVWAIDVGKYLKKRENGAYILAATTLDRDGKPNIYKTKTQWFIISDIGLFTLEDDKGLHIYTKHLSNAKPYNNIKLQLIAKNNEILGQTKIKNNKALFKKALLEGSGGMKAQAIYAYGKDGDFNVLNLALNSLDLSDRGVDGRVLPKDYDAFIYSNRGIFKPKEKIPFHTLIKKLNKTPASNLKVIAKLIDSSSNEVDKLLLATDEFGYSTGEFELSKNAKTGRYKIALYASSKEPIGVLNFLVEDFVPPKIEIKLLHKPKAIIPNKPAIIKANVSYLTKEPLKDAPVEIQRVVHKAKNAFKEYKNYHFGDIDEEFGNEYLAPLSTTTNRDGNITIDISTNERFNTSLPLEIFTNLIAYEPGGRALEYGFNIFYANKEGYIGIKPNFKDDYIDLDAKPEFTILYLKNQNPSSANLNYSLVKEEPSYSWRYERGSWVYQVDYSEVKEIKKGEIKVENSPSLLSLDKLSWGTYKLKISSNNSFSSYRFNSGYWGDGGKHTPDKLPLWINKSQFKPGEILKINIKPKFSGPVMINIANYHIFKTINLEAKEQEEKEIELKVDKSWGSSVYVLATAFRAKHKTMGASRAIGVAHFSIKEPQRILDLNISAPKKIESKSKLKVTITSNKAKDKEVFFTLSAVDKGVLNLTKYAISDPIKYFFGKLRLGVKVRDIYGELIRVQGEHAIYAQGAGDEFDDSAFRDTHIQNREKVVALMTKKLSLKNGKAKVEFNIPTYQGALSLNAIAWSKNALGKASSEVIVKDPISITLYMPRFLAKGDLATLTLRVSFDKQTPKGEYLVKIDTKNLKAIPNEIKVNHSKDSIIKRFKVKALKSKDAKIKIKVFKDNKLLTTQEYELAIKYPLPKSYTRELKLLKPNTLLDIKKLLKDANVTNLIKAYLVVSNKPIIPIESIKRQLLEYEFGCAEQTTSKAFPLLDSKDRYEIQEVKDAITTLEAMQKLNGSFGLWESSAPNLWLSAYVMDFLTQANKKGFKVSKKSLKAGLKYLEESLNRWATSKEEQEANIYALYVLTKNKKIFMSDIEHFVNDTQSKVSSAMAWGQLGVVLKLIGEDKLAKEIFNLAKESLNSSYPYANFGGKLRDKAALITLLSEAGFKDEASSLLIDLGLNLKDKKYLSTQEMSQILRAAKAIDLKLKELKLQIGDKIYNSNKPYTLQTNNIKDFYPIKNIGESDLWVSLSYITTLDENTLKALKDNGFKIEKTIYTLDGKVANLENIAQSDKLVVVLKGKITDSAVTHPLLSDFLPAGFEIENPHISGIDNTSSLSWLKDVSAALYKEYRDDRFSAYFSPKKEFKFAYIIRAVTLGEFFSPPAKIEDMYKPRYRAFIKDIPKVVIKKIASTQTISKKLQEKNNTLANLTQDDYLKAATEPLGDLKKYNLYELNFLRNGIFAYIGLDFSKTNPALFERFSKFSWYKPTISSGSVAYAKLNSIQRKNVQKLLKEEKRRLNGLTLADIYRVKTKALDEKFLQRYNKEQLRILRNSLIAKYGYYFKDSKLSKIFSQFPWYKVDKNISSSEIIDKKMNALERANLMRILSVEKQKASESF